MALVEALEDLELFGRELAQIGAVCARTDLLVACGTAPAKAPAVDSVDVGDRRAPVLAHPLAPRGQGVEVGLGLRPLDGLEELAVGA